MTKLEKEQQKSANRMYRHILKVKSQLVEERIFERELEETVLFHAKCIEKILNKAMPKDWNLKVTLELLDSNDQPYCSCETKTTKGIIGRLGSVTKFILSELLFKVGINERIEEINKNKQL